MPKSRRAEEPKSRRAEEPKSRRAEEPKSRRAEEPKSRRAEEPKIIDPYWFIKGYNFFRKRLQDFFLNWRYMEHIWHDWE